MVTSLWNCFVFCRALSGLKNRSQLGKESPAGKGWNWLSGVSFHCGGSVLLQTWYAKTLHHLVQQQLLHLRGWFRKLSKIFLKMMWWFKCALKSAFKIYQYTLLKSVHLRLGCREPMMHLLFLSLRSALKNNHANTFLFRWSTDDGDGLTKLP